MSVGVMAPPLLPVGVATQLSAGGYALHPAIRSSGSGVELDLSGSRTSTSRQSLSSPSDSAAAVTPGSSSGWPSRHARSAFCGRKVIDYTIRYDKTHNNAVILHVDSEALYH